MLTTSGGFSKVRVSIQEMAHRFGPSSAYGVPGQLSKSMHTTEPEKLLGSDYPMTICTAFYFI